MFSSFIIFYISVCSVWLSHPQFSSYSSNALDAYSRFLGILSAFLRTSKSYNSFLSLRRIFSTCVIALAILFCALSICKCVKASNNPSSIHISIAVAKRPYFNCTLLFFCNTRSSAFKLSNAFCGGADAFLDLN